MLIKALQILKTCQFSRKLRNFAINRVAEILRVFNKDGSCQGAHITCQKLKKNFGMTLIMALQILKNANFQGTYVILP
jgi:hypothetical protein